MSNDPHPISLVILELLAGKAPRDVYEGLAVGLSPEARRDVLIFVKDRIGVFVSQLEELEGLCEIAIEQTFLEPEPPAPAPCPHCTDGLLWDLEPSDSPSVYRQCSACEGTGKR